MRKGNWCSMASNTGSRGRSLMVSTQPTISHWVRSEEHTSELQSLRHLVCRLLLEKTEHRPDLGPPREIACGLVPAVCIAPSQAVAVVGSSPGKSRRSWMPCLVCPRAFFLKYRSPAHAPPLPFGAPFRS